MGIMDIAGLTKSGMIATLPGSYHLQRMWINSRVAHDALVTKRGITTEGIGGGQIVVMDAPATELRRDGYSSDTTLRAHCARIVTMDRQAFANVQQLAAICGPDGHDLRTHPTALPVPQEWQMDTDTRSGVRGLYRTIKADTAAESYRTKQNTASERVFNNHAWGPGVVRDALLTGSGPMIDANVKILEKLVAALRKRLPPAEDLRHRQEWGRDGHTLDAMRALRGDWDTAYRRTARRPRVSSPIVTLVATPGGCQQCSQLACPVTGAAMTLAWGAPVAAATLLLEEAGWRVRVQIALLAAGSRPSRKVDASGWVDGTVITIKEANERVDMGVLAAALCTQPLTFGAYNMATSLFGIGGLRFSGGQVQAVPNGVQLGALWREATSEGVLSRLPAIGAGQLADFFGPKARVPKDLLASALELIAEATGGHLLEVREKGRVG